MSFFSTDEEVKYNLEAVKTITVQGNLTVPMITALISAYRGLKFLRKL